MKGLLFWRGVGKMNPKFTESSKFKENILGLNEAGVEKATCVSIAEPLGLTE